MAFKGLGIRIMNLGNMFVSFGEIVGEILFGIHSVFKAVVKPINDMIGSLVLALSQITNITNPKEALAGLMEAKRLLGEGFGGLFNLDDETSAFNNMIDGVTTASARFVDDVGNDFKEGSREIDHLFKGIGEDGVDAVEEIRQKIVELKRLLMGGGLDAESGGFWGGFVSSWLVGAETIAGETKILAKDMEGIFRKASDNMTDSFVRFFNEGKFGMKDMVSDMLAQLQRLIIQRSIVNPILSHALGFIGTTFGLDLSSNEVEPKAKGGSVSSGKPYLVGEQGMEMFVPKSAGTIVPNGAMGGGGVVVNFNVEATDANSFDQQIGQREQMIVGMIESAFNRQGKVGIYG
jgi:hypothetical protein